MILRGEVLDGEVVNITSSHNKIFVQPNHEVMYEADEDEDLENMDIEIEDMD